MKLAKIKFGLILFVFFLASCGNKEEKAIIGKSNNRYSELKEKYPNVLIQHFPKDFADKNGEFDILISYPSEYSATQLLVTKKESNKVIDSIRSISEQLTYESHLLIVNRYLRRENLLNLPMQYDNYDVQEYFEGAIPIPNFYKHKNFDESSSTKLNSDCLIFLLKSNKGRCCDDIYHKGDWHMPDQWKDGFSSGYAINMKSNMVTYWSVVW